MGTVRREMAKSVAQEGHELVSGNRHEDYGGWRVDYECVSAYFRLLTNGKYDLTPAEGVKFMLAVKLSRESRKHKRDNLVDLCGYAVGLDELEGDGND